MIYITGDCHREYRRFNTQNFPEQKGMTKEDYVIVCGDFGGVWSFEKEDKEKLLSLGGQLGYLDTQMQERTLLLYLEQLELSISRLRGEMRERCRLSTALGMMGSLLLVILMY